jgi:putative hydrolase of the HAD superfamily
MEPTLRERILARYQTFDPVPTGEATRLADLSRVRAMVFDVYGTIMLSAAGDIGAHEESTRVEMFARAAEATGFELGAEAEKVSAGWRQAVKESHARSREAGVEHPEIDVREIWRELMRQGLLKGEGSVEALAVEFEMMSNPVALEPGLVDLLASLTSRGIVLGIVSNAQFYTPLILETLLGQSLEAAGFRPVYCVWSYREREAKPSVRLYEKLATALRADGITPEETLYVGNDMRNDITPAAVCGFMTALYAGDQRSLRLRESHPACRDTRSDVVITRLAELSIV